MVVQTRVRVGERDVERAREAQAAQHNRHEKPGHPFAPRVGSDYTPDLRKRGFDAS